MRNFYLLGVFVISAIIGSYQLSASTLTMTDSPIVVSCSGDKDNNPGDSSN